MLGKKGKRYTPRFQFQVVLEALNGDRDAVEMALEHDLHSVSQGPTGVFDSWYLSTDK
jgi:transposase-like protein